MKLCSVVVLLQILLLASFATARPEVVFPAEAEISNTATARILEVAELKDFTAEAFAEISSLPIWEAKSASGIDRKQPVVLSGPEISKKLRDYIASSPLLKKAIPSFKIPEQVTLTVAPGISRTAIERGLKNTLLAKCAQCTYQLKISSVPKTTSQNWSIDYDQDLKNGAFMLPVQDTASNANLWIAGSYHLRKKVPVLKKSIHFGERLQTEDFEMADADITFLRESPPAGSDLVGQMATRVLQAKTALVASDFKKEPAAHRGQILKALVGDETFEVSINVTAEENGAIGDLIKIQNPDTRKMMSGLIVDKGVVKVQ